MFTQTDSFLQVGSLKELILGPVLFWMMGMKAPAPSLLMTLSWVVRWTHQKGEPSYRDN